MPVVKVGPRGEISVQFGLRKIGAGIRDPHGARDAAETGQMRHTGHRNIFGPSVVDLDAGTSTPMHPDEKNWTW